MRKILPITMCLILLLCIITIPVSAAFSTASGAAPRFNNTAITTTNFVIQQDGCADVHISYTGYEGTTGATITTKLQKKILGLFWIDININKPNNMWTDNAIGNNYSNIILYSVGETI